MDGCKRNDDFVKCESCLATVDDTWIFVAASLLFIDSDRKFLYRQKPKHFAIDKLIYFHEAKERIRAPRRISRNLKCADNNPNRTKNEVSISL